ncbi:MAG: hypothetical protein CFE37_08805 [Alphaproteobacteria bacterium PA4]|nr:MAG: hypothetical protein CFE37_08805 [Alphaproteobacteria bacterium PA4]
MSLLARLCLCFALLAAGPALAQDSGGSAYAIGGIDVDVTAANPNAARITAYRIAQRKAWPLLWARLTGAAAASAPHLSDGQLDGIVSGIESQGERFSMTRYIARLGVVFDRSRASAYFAGQGGALQSPPMLLLPVWRDGGASTLYQAKTPWRAAWARYRENVTPIDYVVASGSPGDNLVLTGWQVRRPERAGWRNILNRFDAVDVLTAEARVTRSWPGGPISAEFIARHGPDAAELGRFTLSTTSPEGLDAMLDTAVRQIDDIYGEALRAGRLRAEVDLSADMAPLIGAAPLIGSAASEEEVDGSSASASVEAAMATPDAATATALEGQLRRIAGVSGVTVTSLSLGGTTRMLITYTGSYEALLYALDGKGLRLVVENGQTVLRRRIAGDTPVPAPAGPPPAAPAPTTPAVPLAEPARRARPDPAAAAKPAATLPPKPAATPPTKPAAAPRKPSAPIDLLPVK